MPQQSTPPSPFGLGMLLLALLPLAPLAAQRGVATDTAFLQRMLVAEDARGLGTEGIGPLLDGLQRSDTLLRRWAVRGLGRLQRPELAARLAERLSDPVSSIRAEAANAVIQSLRNVRRSAPATDPGQVTAREAQASLLAALGREQDPAALDAIAEAVGRLPLGDSLSARVVEGAIVDRAGTRPGRGLIHGLYRLVLARRFTGGLSPRGIGLLRQQATASADTGVRRTAVLALGLQGALDSLTLRTTIQDRDPQVRRLTLAGVASLTAEERRAVVRRALADPSPIVRVDAVGAARVGSDRPDCAPIIGAVRDREPAVVLTAIDALGLPCADSAASRVALLQVLERPGTDRILTHRWQAPSHALVALAQLDSAGAARFVVRAAGATRWEERLYAARAATASRDPATLYALARDPDFNVQEAVVAGLQKLVGHAADSIYLATLGSEGHQAVLAAATALDSSTSPAAPALLLAAFERLSRHRSENSRDPRMEILARLDQLGRPADAPRLLPFAADFDSSVAVAAARIVSRWTGTTVAPRPAALPIRTEPLARLALSRNLRLRLTLADSSGGGSIVVRLLPEETPASVARFIRLADQHYFEGHVLQRVEPNFVIQGGGPGASEYVGDAAFMRDELSRRPSFRGTLGVSSRGRDTGDAQLYINLVDNPILDHEFTIFGYVETGLGVMDRILEGDVIARVTVEGR